MHREEKVTLGFDARARARDRVSECRSEIQKAQQVVRGYIENYTEVREFLEARRLVKHWKSEKRAARAVLDELEQLPLDLRAQGLPRLSAQDKLG